MAPAAREIRGAPSMARVLANYERIRRDRPAYFEARQKRIDLRNDYLRSEYARNWNREFNDIQQRLAGMMGPLFRREQVRMQAAAAFRRLHGFHPKETAIKQRRVWEP